MENKQIIGRYPPEIIMGLGFALMMMDNSFTKKALEDGILTYEDEYKLIVDKLKRSIKEYEELYNIENPFKLNG